MKYMMLSASTSFYHSPGGSYESATGNVENVDTHLLETRSQGNPAASRADYHPLEETLRRNVDTHFFFLFAFAAKVLKHQSKTSLSPAEMLSLLINNCNQ